MVVESGRSLNRSFGRLGMSLLSPPLKAIHLLFASPSNKSIEECPGEITLHQVTNHFHLFPF